MGTTRTLPLLAAVGLLCAAGASRADDAASAGAVFALTNAADANAVLAFARADDGTLQPAGEARTGGRGTGAGLGSQGSLVLSRDGRLLFAVDAGSDEVASFRVRGTALQLVSHLPSGGSRPVSVTSSGGLLYVLNAGGDGNVSGFTVGEDGVLQPLAGSARPLSAAQSAPAQVQFSPHGELLAVTERATSRISLYAIDLSGRPVGPDAYASSGATPFGFAFTRHGDLIVSEAEGGAANAGTVSSYSAAALVARTFLTPISASVPDGETAPCWLTTTVDSRFAFTANAGTASVSSYAIARDGSLSLVASKAGAVSRPLELSLSAGSDFLYVVSGGAGRIAAFRVGDDGSLAPVPGASGLPATTIGVAAR